MRHDFMMRPLNLYNPLRCRKTSRLQTGSNMRHLLGGIATRIYKKLQTPDKFAPPDFGFISAE